MYQVKLWWVHAWAACRHPDAYTHTIIYMYMNTYARINILETKVSSRSLFRPVGMKLGLHLSLAAIVKELYIDISPDVLGVPANAHFGLLDLGFGEVRSPQPTPSDPRHTAWPGHALGFPGEGQTADVSGTYLVPGFPRRSHVDRLIIVQVSDARVCPVVEEQLDDFRLVPVAVQCSCHVQSCVAMSLMQGAKKNE